ncbi:hypothetical protein [Nocardia sp. NPDC057030]|uniref:hypothetical protein n=1 Tax=unclassified Nocardia TaxID=2637762 RepID=UPI00363BE726
MSEDTQLALLREPFSANQINKLPKPFSKDAKRGSCHECGGYHGLPALHLDYVGHAALTHRLLDVDPRWSWEPLALDDRGLPVFDANGGLWIRLTICGVTRLGYGDAEGKRGGNAVKEAIGDALRNAGMRFGMALDLWHKGDLHDASEKRGTVPPDQAADLARAELLAVLRRVGIEPAEAADRFVAEGHGLIDRSTDAAAIKALTAHYLRIAGEEA